MESTNEEIKAESELAILEGEMRDEIQPAHCPFESAQRVSELGWLKNKPPKRKYLFEQPVGLGLNEGFLPLGKTAMLISPGGVGKTFALTQCALAAATGTKWFDTYQATKAGTVLFITAEEDDVELWGRLYRCAKGMNLTQEQMELAAQNLVPIPLFGKKARLTDKEGSATEKADSIKKCLYRFDDCQLIILDPASFFMGPNCELDNAAATDWVTILNSFTKAPGSPTVLISHHTNKAAMRPADNASDATQNQSSARGSSGLVDGVRWVAALWPIKGKDRNLVTFKLEKTNYCRFPEPINLMRDADHGGMLKLAPKVSTLEKLCLKEKTGYGVTGE